MLIEFNIQYHTGWGENLTLVLNGRECPMRWNEGDRWSIKTECSQEELDSYFYKVVQNGETVRIEWDNHRATPSARISDKWIDCPEGCDFIRRHNAEKFDRPGFRGAGTVVPVFSLRSRDDFGIGDFADLHLLTDWAVRTGQSVIQILPVNDTTRKGNWDDSYPYSPVSSFALHPLYVRLQDVGVKEDNEFKREQAELNGLAEIDYPKVFEAKMRYLRKAFGIRGGQDTGGLEFKEWRSRNEDWLDEYSSFCAERDGNEKKFHEWVQFHLDKQFSREAAYARSKGISLKGDLPIGVSADSADAKYHPNLFNLDSCAGAPPDFFSQNGQNWGFPTYNWDNMARDGYSWWKRRLRKMSEYFDAFRIDHILGFFRIWEIPAGETSGKAGHFNPALPYSAGEILSLGIPIEGLFHEDPRHTGSFQPLISPDTSALEIWQKERFDALYNDFFFHRHDEFWRIGAEKKFSAILASTGMLACGEDLGMLSDCVPGVMAHHRILSLEMPMMDKGRPWPRLSVCTTSSHDMETLRMQQDEDPEPWFCRRKLWECVSSESLLAIIPIQDWLSLDGGLRRSDRDAERINEPADPHHHWRYRMHIAVEDLLNEEKASNLSEEIESLLKDSGRFIAA